MGQNARQISGDNILSATTRNWSSLPLETGGFLIVVDPSKFKALVLKLAGKLEV
jgi:hypothetical protein